MDYEWLVKMISKKRHMLVQEAILDFDNDFEESQAEIERINKMSLKEVEAEFKALGLVYPKSKPKATVNVGGDVNGNITINNS